MQITQNRDQNRRPGVMRRLRWFVCVCGLCWPFFVEAIDDDSVHRSRTVPRSTPWSADGRPRWSPSPHVPLAGVVEATTSMPVRVTVNVSSGDESWDVHGSEEPTTDHRIVILGLKPDRQYQLAFTTSDGEQRSSSESISVTTPPLPADFPTLDVVTADPLRMEPGVTLCSILRWEDDFASLDVGWFVAIDHSGEPVWYLRLPEPAGAIRRLPNGNFLFLHGARPTGLREIDPLGNVVRQYRAVATGMRAAAGELEVDVDTFHHDVHPLRNGNHLVLTTEVRQIDGVPASVNRLAVRQAANLVGDVVVELTPAGEIAGRWPLLGILDPRRVGHSSLDSFWDLRAYPFVPGGTKDWSHCNSVIHDHTDDSLIVCLRHQDAIVKVDRATSEVMWILGDPTGWTGPFERRLLRPKGRIQWPYHAHGVKFHSDTNRLLVFDNGNCRALPPNRPQTPARCYSRAVEYEIDQQNGIVREVWSYGGPGANRFFSAFVGDADWLPQTGNVLITDGGRLESRTGAPLGEPPGDFQWGRVLEVTRDAAADVVFELHASEKGRNNPYGSSIYRAERLPDLRIAP